MAFGNLKTTTIREFDGGLNVVTDDLNMDRKYSTIETNVFNNINGTKAKRYGTKFLVDITKYPRVTEKFKVVKLDTNFLWLESPTNANYGEVGKMLYGNSKNSGVFRAIGSIKEVGSGYLTVSRVNMVTANKYFYYFDSNNKKVEFEGYWDNPDSLLDAKIIITAAQNNLYINDRITITKPTTYNRSLLNRNLIIEKIKVENNKQYIGINLDDIDFDINLISTTNIPDNITTSKDKITYKAVKTNKEYESGWKVNETDEYYTVALSSKEKDNYLYKDTDNNDLIVGHILNYKAINYVIDDVKIIREDVGNILKVYYHLKDFTFSDPDAFTTGLTFTHDNRNMQGTCIINCEYFVDKIIAVSDIGEVIMIDGEQNASIIWNDTIAKTLNKEPDINGWSKPASVCFAVFNGKLTLWNGQDKPLVINIVGTNIYRPCNFLYDEATNSNAYVPRAKYAIAFNHYLVCGCIMDDDGTLHEDKISISMRDAIGTFYADGSTDAYETSLGKIISTNNQQIKGLSRYRDRLVVGFADVSVFGTLGEYEEVTTKVENPDTGEFEDFTENKHVPNFDDVVEDNGCISNRTYRSIGSDLICLDYSGLPSFRKTGIYSIIQPARISNLIKTEIYTKYIGLTESEVEHEIFSIHNPKDNQYLLFIPHYEVIDDKKTLIDYYCYAYTLNNKTNASILSGAWSKFTGWNFQCGCTSALNDVFLFNKTKLYQLGNTDYPYYADFIDDPDYPATEDSPSGKEIDFEWEFPWADFGDRAATKHSRYLSISSTGTSQFCIDFFTDYIYYNNYYNRLDPQLTLDFVAGDSVGWGNGNIMENNKIVDYKGHQNYGGGRITNNELLFAWTTKFKIGKFRIHGSSKYKLNINSITLYYQMGNIRR